MTEASPAPAGWVVRSGCGMAELLALRHHWLALAARLEPKGFQHLFWWYESYLGHLEREVDSVHFFSFFRDQDVVAIFPLRCTRRTVGGVQLRVWELPWHSHMALCDFMLNPVEDLSGLLKQLVRVLDQQPWDALYLPNLLAESLTLRAARLANLPAMLLEATDHSMHFTCVDLPSAIAKLPPTLKVNLRRQRKKLERRGRVDFVLARTKDELAAAFEAFIKLEASGWKGRCGAGSAISLHPCLMQFYRGLINSNTAHEGCQIHLLTLDGEAIAAQFCLLAGDTLSIQKIAYAETYRAESPGHQLLYEALHYCCASPAIQRLSLITGPTWAGERWHPEVQDVWRIWLYKPSSWRGVLVYVLRTGKAKMKALERQLRRAATSASAQTASANSR